MRSLTQRDLFWEMGEGALGRKEGGSLGVWVRVPSFASLRRVHGGGGRAETSREAPALLSWFAHLGSPARGWGSGRSWAGTGWGPPRPQPGPWRRPPGRSYDNFLLIKALGSPGYSRDTVRARLPGSLAGLFAGGGNVHARRAADARPVTRSARPARARRGRRQTLGHPDPNFGFTAGGVGGAWT